MKAQHERQVTLRQVSVRALTLLGIASLVFLTTLSASGQTAKTIVDEWAAVTPPPPPVLRTVAVDPRTTALLILDILQQSCNEQRRPRCVASIPRISALLARASSKEMLVVYSHTFGPTVDDILRQVRPLGGEPVVVSNADKFIGTDLEKILRDRGIRTVIPVGTAAHGAVLHTSSAAALRGFQVVLPVDGLSAETLYFEQYTVFHLANAPTIAARVTLTRSDLIQF